MRNVYIRGIDLSKLVYLWEQSDLKISLFLQSFIKRSIHLEQLEYFTDGKNFIFIEKSRDFSFCHCAYDDLKVIKDFILTMPRTFCWLTHDDENENLPSLNLYEKSFSMDNNTGPLSEEVCTQEEIFRLLETVSPQDCYAENLSMISKSILQKSFLIRRSDDGNINYLQLFSVEESRYYGLFLWSRLSPVETIKNLILGHRGPYGHFRTYILSSNLPSVAIHTSLGYVFKRPAAYLLKSF